MLWRPDGPGAGRPGQASWVLRFLGEGDQALKGRMKLRLGGYAPGHPSALARGLGSGAAAKAARAGQSPASTTEAKPRQSCRLTASRCPVLSESRSARKNKLVPTDTEPRPKQGRGAI